MLKKLLAVKPVQLAVEDSGFEKTLGAKQLVALGIGAIIGAGIFVMTGQAAAHHAGPAIMLSFVLAGMACAFAGLCYAEFAALLPVSGSAYSYAYATLGEGIAWFIGWALILEYLFSASAVAVGWSGYFTSFLQHIGSATGLDLQIPHILREAPFTFDQNIYQSTGSIYAAIVRTGYLFNLPAVFITLLVGSVCYVGIRQSAWVNALVVAVKLIVIFLVIIIGLNYVNPSNWQPFFPEQTGPTQFGWDGMVRAASIIFFAYIGFDAVSTAAQEAKNPQRDMPIGILGSLLICTVLYIAVAAVLTGMESYTKLGTAEPVVTALLSYPELGWLRWIVEIGAIAGLTSVILVMLLAQPRIFYTMSRDGLLPKALSKIHTKYATPHVATVVTVVLATALAALFPLGVLGDLVSMGTILAFMTVCIGVIVLRKTRPDLVRPFRVPMVWLIAPLGVLSCVYLLSFMGAFNWILLGAWTSIGMLVYFAYGFRKSRLRQ